MLANPDCPHIAVVMGTRPEIVKLSHIVRILGPRARLFHSGQHTDQELSGVFFAAAGMPVPEPLAGIRGEPRHVQVGRITEQLGAAFARRRPAAVVVQGDTNTAMAAAQAANYSGVPVVHVEAGLRSFDRRMPEEINRCVIGVLADLHCAPTERAAANLTAEGVPGGRIALTGNTIVEATLEMLPGDEASRSIVAAAGAEPGRYVLATIHRPENTDDPLRLRAILEELAKLGLPVLFPMHPRTRLAAGAARPNRGARPAARPAASRPPDVPRPGPARPAAGLRFRRRPGGVHGAQAAAHRGQELHRAARVHRGRIRPPGPAGPAIGDLGRRLIGDESLAARLAALALPLR